MNGRLDWPPRSRCSISSTFFAALYPVNQDAETADPDTREFLLAVVQILLDFISKTNDRSEKVVEFQHPSELKKVLDLAIPDQPQPLDTLLEDCRNSLRHQVKTGKGIKNDLIRYVYVPYLTLFAYGNVCSQLYANDAYF